MAGGGARWFARQVLLRVQIATYLAVLIGMATLVQSIFAARTLHGLLAHDSAETARLVAQASTAMAACRPDDRPCVEAALRDALGRTRLVDPDQVRRAQGGLVGAICLAAAAALIGSLLLMERTVLRPVRGLTEAAERAARLEAGPFLVPGAGPVLGGLATTLDRTMHALEEERARTVAQVEELSRVNSRLAEARDSLAVSEKLATVGRLAAGVAHEVGNPLSAILGYLDLARSRAGQRDELNECLDRIEAEIRRIDGIVRQLLTFARPAPIQLGPTSVPAVVDAAVRLASMPARAREVEIIRDIPEGLPCVVAEEQRLAQVLVNLLFNAADAMRGKGTVEIHARLVEVDGPARRAGDVQPGPRVVLSVADSGPGILAEHLPRIFDPFFTTKEPGEGTGLGLAICHGILESFGGEIRATNRPSGGAEFSLILRAEPPGEASARERA